MVLVFDLDDTLYDEITYVHSGLRAVAHHLTTNYLVDYDFSYTYMQESLQKNGRGRVFNDVLMHIGKYNKKNVRKCLSVYRMHAPAIRLKQPALNCLQDLQKHPLYIVTDGNKIVQHNKVKALELYAKVNKVFFTHRYGVKHSKPSPYCFQKIAAKENVSMTDIVYVGDNPNKDFIGIKPLGCRTVRINQGMFKNVFLDAEHEAHVTIDNIQSLTDSLLANLVTKRK